MRRNSHTVHPASSSRDTRRADFMAGAAPLSRENLIRGLLLAAATLLILHGVLNGSMRDVFIKAIHICTECIGLG